MAEWGRRRDEILARAAPMSRPIPLSPKRLASQPPPITREEKTASSLLYSIYIIFIFVNEIQTDGGKRSYRRR